MIAFLGVITIVGVAVSKAIEISVQAPSRRLDEKVKKEPLLKLS